MTLIHLQCSGFPIFVQIGLISFPSPAFLDEETGAYPTAVRSWAKIPRQEGMYGGALLRFGGIQVLRGYRIKGDPGPSPR